MTIGIVTGSGTYALPGFEDDGPETVETPWGPAAVTRGSLAGVDAVHVSRHGAGHVRLSNHVNHRANAWALRQLGCRAVVGCTACGAVDPAIALGSIVVFDDLHFPVNRLPDGSICSFHVEEGDPARGHWIYERPFSDDVRGALLAAAAETGVEHRDGGCYGHVDGPRFNTRTEIAQLAAAGVAAVSQTAGPETVLCGELALPYALMGFATDYANGVHPAATPVDELVRLMQRSPTLFARILTAALPRLSAAEISPAGTVLRFDSP